MTREQIALEVEKIVYNIVRLGGNDHWVFSTTSLKGDLDFDELDLMELTYDLEERFKLTISDEDVYQAQEVSDVIELIVRMLREKEKAKAS